MEPGNQKTAKGVPDCLSIVSGGLHNRVTLLRYALDDNTAPSNTSHPYPGRGRPDARADLEKIVGLPLSTLPAFTAVRRNF